MHAGSFAALTFPSSSFFLSRHPTYSCACCVSIRPSVRSSVRPLARPSARIHACIQRRARASERVLRRRTHTRSYKRGGYKHQRTSYKHTRIYSCTHEFGNLVVVVVVVVAFCCPCVSRPSNTTCVYADGVRVGTLYPVTRVSAHFY